MSRVLRCSGYDLVLDDIVRAEGCRLFDASGRSYVDFEAGVWCAALGHNPPRLREAVVGQLERIAHIGYRYTTEIVERAASDLLGVLDMEAGQCVFLSSGSEAVEFSVQAARVSSGRPLLLGFADVFLGSYGTIRTQPSDAWWLFDVFACDGCPDADDCDRDCPRLAEIPYGRIGAFVFEPGCSSGLVRLPVPGPVREIARRVRAAGGLLVVNEVTTGMGRTGAWFGHRHYDLTPDLVAVGKGLGNGYPVSAVALSGDVARRLTETGFHYAQSHQNDPLGCAVAVEVIRALRDDELVERSRRLGADLLKRLSAFAERHETIAEVRGRGLMLAIVLRRDVPAIEVYRKLLDGGLIVGCKPAFNLLRLMPPLTVPEDDVHRLIEALDDVLSRRS